MTTATLSEVYRGLEQFGLSKSQVAAILPDWWAPPMARSDAGLWETAVLLGRRLSLDAAALLQGRIEQTPDVAQPRFKHTVRVTPMELGPAVSIASSLAKAILAATSERGEIEPRSASSVREAILSNPKARIDFDSLLEFCWGAGIPVIPLPNLPRGVRKMDAAAIKIGARYAIVIALHKDSKAWLSFLLAHELGHICLGHVPENAAIVEGSLRDSTVFDVESQQDTQETQANEFAHALLGGADADAIISRWNPTTSPVTLAANATQDAAALRTAPGHLILRHAFRTHRWPTSQSALHFLADDFDAQASLVSRLQAEIDTNAIAEDLQDYVEQITGVAPQA
jgi:Zn-dependent peptidase ImmA (M78 family)